MGKQKSAAAAGAVATGPVPRPPVLEHTTAELVSLIARALLRCRAANSERSRSSVEPWQPLRNHSDQRESSRKGKAIVTAMRSKYIYVLARVLE